MRTLIAVCLLGVFLIGCGQQLSHETPKPGTPTGSQDHSQHTESLTPASAAEMERNADESAQVADIASHSENAEKPKAPIARTPLERFKHFAEEMRATLPTSFFFVNFTPEPDNIEVRYDVPKTDASTSRLVGVLHVRWVENSPRGEGGRFVWEIKATYAFMDGVWQKGWVYQWAEVQLVDSNATKASDHDYLEYRQRRMQSFLNTSPTILQLTGA